MTISIPQSIAQLRQAIKNKNYPIILKHIHLFDLMMDGPNPNMSDLNHIRRPALDLMKTPPATQHDRFVRAMAAKLVYRLKDYITEDEALELMNIPIEEGFEEAIPITDKNMTIDSNESDRLFYSYLQKINCGNC